MATMILFAVFWPPGEPFSATFRLIGGVLAVLGLVLSVIGSRTFRKVGTNIMTFDKPDKLVTTGLFALRQKPLLFAHISGYSLERNRHARFWGVEHPCTKR